MEKEIWKPVVGYKGLYEVSSLGRVKSLKRETPKSDGRIQYVKERILKPCMIKGYLAVGLHKLGKCRTRTIHIIMAKAFLNHKTSSKILVDHIDNDQLNNKLDNLQIVTSRYNSSKDRKGTSKYTGVSLKKKCIHKKWIAQINLNGKVHHLGYFYTEKEAHLAYQERLNQHLNNDTRPSDQGNH